MKFPPSLAFAALLACACPGARAQQTYPPSPPFDQGDPPAAHTSGDNYKITVRSNLVFLPTRVQTRSGETIYGLKADQFIVEDNGVRQSVRIEEDPDSTGLSLVVVIQCSRSADKEFNKFKGLVAMIDEMVGEAPHEVAVISYGEGIYTLGNFTSNSDDVRRSLSRLKECGDYSAVSIDAAEYAITMLKGRQNHFRRAVLLISEGRDHGSRAKLRDVVAELGITDTVIYTVAFSPAKDEFIRTLRYGSPDSSRTISRSLPPSLSPVLKKTAHRPAQASLLTRNLCISSILLRLCCLPSSPPSSMLSGAVPPPNWHLFPVASTSSSLRSADSRRACSASLTRFTITICSASKRPPNPLLAFTTCACVFPTIPTP